MWIYFYPLTYLRLRNEAKRLIALRDAFAVGAITVVMSIAFIAAESKAYFGDHGFLDRMGTLSSTLTGFYVAALVAVATFSIGSKELDQPISVGQVLVRDKDVGDFRVLTRREYVCSIFGYLSFQSLLIALYAGVVVSLSESAAGAAAELSETSHYLRVILFSLMPSFFVILGNILLSHLVVTTLHGLYYLIDRLYAKRPEMLEKKGK